MKINRWSAEIVPNCKIIENLLIAEGLEPRLINVPSGGKIMNQRTSVTEIIQIVEGELIFNLSGAQFALRNGDRLEMAANTQYSYSNLKDSSAAFFSGQRL